MQRLRRSPSPQPSPGGRGGKASNAYQLASLRDALRPFRLHWFPTLRSTSDHAAAMRKAGSLYAPAVVLTSRQTAGRGRGDHAWWSASGCVTATFVFPADDQTPAHQLPLVAGLAIRRAAAELGAPAAQLKWPNDILLSGRKLGGLLCERMMKIDLVGVGLNVNLNRAAAPEFLQSRIASLSEIVGSDIDLNLALSTMARHMLHARAEPARTPFAALLQEYDAHHALVGRRVSVTFGPSEPAVSGKCEGLDETGRLLLRSRGTLHRVVAGHVEMIG